MCPTRPTLRPSTGFGVNLLTDGHSESAQPLNPLQLFNTGDRLSTVFTGPPPLPEVRGTLLSGLALYGQRHWLLKGSNVHFTQDVQQSRPMRG